MPDLEVHLAPLDEVRMVTWNTSALFSVSDEQVREKRVRKAINLVSKNDIVVFTRMPRL